MPVGVDRAETDLAFEDSAHPILDLGSQVPDFGKEDSQPREYRTAEHEDGDERVDAHANEPSARASGLGPGLRTFVAHGV